MRTPRPLKNNAYFLRMMQMGFMYRFDTYWGSTLSKMLWVGTPTKLLRCLGSPLVLLFPPGQHSLSLRSGLAP